MLGSPLKDILRRVLCRELLLDLEDQGRAGALKAFEMVRDRSGLNRKRARELEGQARFRMMEQGFEEVCTLHGGHLLQGSVIPTTDLKVFQPFMRFEVAGQGIILGLAAMPDRKVMPGKNKSRVAGVALNYDLVPRLDLDGKGPKIGDVFSLLLVSRHKEKAGLLDEIAIGVIDSEYSTFLFYEPFEEFLTGHGDVSVAQTSSSTPIVVTPASAVTLKKNVIPFVPPERPKQDEDEKEKK